MDNKEKEIKRMGFSQRLKVVEEYYLWKRQEENESKFGMIDNHETFLAFLEIRGYRKAEEVRKETAKEIFNALYHQEEIGFDKIKWFAKYYYGIEVDE